jgi:valyl-tRNA synthetase
MTISKTYNPREIEEKWYSYWLENRSFHSEPDEREPYTIVIPPPNVTGVLHMGHMLNNTIQDVLIRRARMLGKNACWVPGTDHASIATEAKVVALLKEKGINKKDISREVFLQHAWEWKEKYGGIILEQLKKLGCSCDWERTRFTMEPELSEAVIDVFIDLYKKGIIYRGVRMVNWDPQGKTALSDEEVIHKETNAKLYYIRYYLTGDDGYLTIATTRPETIFADTAICINPADERYTHLHGKTVLIPLIKREIPIILDEYVSMDFGTGCLKVTPAHDLNDYNLGIKHNLPVIDILNDDGTLNEKAKLYVGEDRFAVRKKMGPDLEEAGHLEKIEDYKTQVGRSERTDAVIEPRLSMQWFVDMKKFMERNPEVLDAVMNDEIKFYPPKFKNTYKYWIDNIKDWCISRQLWWGQQIPAWYNEAGEFVIAKSRENAISEFKSAGLKFNADTIRQDEDVLDTWFSSWLWPISVFDGFKDKDNKDILYYYPTNDLVTAPEILFFWVARMIMSGYEYRGDMPFKNVYLTGIVRDKQRRKMSKSLGNSPDPLDLIDTYGADGVRLGMLVCSPAGNDILFDESQVEQGRNFCNKIWNAFRLLKGWEIIEDDKADKAAVASNKISIQWFASRFDETLQSIDEKFTDYRLSEALMSIYKLVWDDFCAWYLEMIKPGYTLPINRSAYEATAEYFKKLMQLLHPFMPFITAEIWNELDENGDSGNIIISEWPRSSSVKSGKDLMSHLDRTIEIISQIRNYRNSRGMSPKTALDISINPYEAASKQNYEKLEYLLKKLANVGSVEFTEKGKDAGSSFMADKDEVVVLSGQEIDVEAEVKRISGEIDYLKGFLRSVDAKLSNEKFVANAKAEIVENEIKKKTDAQAKISLLEESLHQLQG